MIHHRHMARLAAAGFTPTEIAEATGFSCMQITKILASPLFQKEVARIEALADKSACDLRADLQALAIKAVCNLEEDIHIADGLESPRDLTNFERKLRYQASTDVLDRVGLGGKNFSVNNIHLHQDEHKHIHSLGVEQLRNEVMDLLRGDQT
jgi:hypothetical protein